MAAQEERRKLEEEVVVVVAAEVRHVMEEMRKRRMRGVCIVTCFVLVVESFEWGDWFL